MGQAGRKGQTGTTTRTAKVGQTGKTGQPSWAKRILKLLEQAKAKDPDLVRFGAYSHKYRVSAPASEEAIQNFEEQQGIKLPWES